MDDLNILLIVAGIVLLINVAAGYKKGLVKSVISLVSLIFTCIVAIILGNVFYSYNDGEMFNVILLILLLCVIGVVRHLLGLLFFSAKVISSLPIVSWVNKLLGMAFGVLETLLLLWTVYKFNTVLNLGEIGRIIIENTEQSNILTWVEQHNYLAYLIEQIGF